MKISEFNRNALIFKGVHKKIFEEKMFLNENRDNNNYVFRMTANLLDKLLICESFNHELVKQYHEFFNTFKKEGYDYLEFDLNKLKSKLLKLKDDADHGNISFIAECEPLVIVPIRIKYEKLYRYFNDKELDENLNLFFDN